MSEKHHDTLHPDRKVIRHHLTAWLRGMGLDDTEMARLGWDEEARDAIETVVDVVHESLDLMHRRTEGMPLGATRIETTLAGEPANL